jgi:hypothetical protein
MSRSTSANAKVNEPRTSLGSPLVGVCASGRPTPARVQNETVATAESGRGIVSETEGKYSVELFKEGGEGAGQEEIIDWHDNLTIA